MPSLGFVVQLASASKKCEIYSKKNVNLIAKPYPYTVASCYTSNISKLWHDCTLHFPED